MVQEQPTESACSVCDKFAFSSASIRLTYHPVKAGLVFNSVLIHLTSHPVKTGHAPMTDLWSNKDLGRILLHFHKTQKPTASMCHGVVGLLSTRTVDPNNPWCYKGYEMTCYSNTEEKTNEAMFGSNLPFKVIRMTDCCRYA